VTVKRRPVGLSPAIGRSRSDMPFCCGQLVYSHDGDPTVIKRSTADVCRRPTDSVQGRPAVWSTSESPGCQSTRSTCRIKLALNDRATSLSLRDTISGLRVQSARPGEHLLNILLRAGLSPRYDTTAKCAKPCPHSVN